MSSIKNIIKTIIGPFLYISNVSSIKGIFPNSMKIANVIPVFKNLNMEKKCIHKL